MFRSDASLHMLNYRNRSSLQRGWSISPATLLCLPFADRSKFYVSTPSRLALRLHHVFGTLKFRKVCGKKFSYSVVQIYAVQLIFRVGAFICQKTNRKTPKT